MQIDILLLQMYGSCVTFPLNAVELPIWQNNSDDSNLVCSGRGRVLEHNVPSSGMKSLLAEMGFYASRDPNDMHTE